MGVNRFARFAVILLMLALSAGAAPRRRVVQVSGSTIRHIIVVVLENEDAAKADDQPFLRELGTRGAVLRNFHAITHPSQPNYIAMIAGSTLGVTGSDSVLLDATHIGDLLEEKGLTWKVYAENYPGNCYAGEGVNEFVTRHVPFLRFWNIRTNPQRCARITEASTLDADIASDSLPTYALYVPNNLHNGHDTSVAEADLWLRGRFDPLLSNPKFTDGTLLVVTFDEGTVFGPNVVYTVLLGSEVRTGAVSDVRYDHYSLLRTIEEIFNLGTLGRNDAAAAHISDIWR